MNSKDSNSVIWFFLFRFRYFYHTYLIHLFLKGSSSVISMRVTTHRIKTIICVMIVWRYHIIKSLSCFHRIRDKLKIFTLRVISDRNSFTKVDNCKCSAYSDVWSILSKLTAYSTHPIKILTNSSGCCLRLWRWFAEP